MRSKRAVWFVAVIAGGVIGAGSLTAQSPQPRQGGPLDSPSAVKQFRSDDPLAVDNDSVADASSVKEVELSEGFDLLVNQFGSPGDRTARRAVNVNTIDEVPNSSWFTNRIGVRDLTIAEIVRGANTFEPAEARNWQEWTIVGGKGFGGFQPGFRAERPGDPGRVYQLEVDPRLHPRLSTGAEFIGTLVYHAAGYNVEDFYLIKVRPENLTISDKATIKDPSGERKYTTRDLANVLSVAATDAEGYVYLSAQRRTDGDDLGHFQYHGTRSDDPNDIYPHEHRRELRGNRVFGAWLNHDDSRALNTRNVRIKAGGRNYVRHYMHDFGAILGSGTRFPDPAISNHEYFIEQGASVRQLFTLGLSTPKPLRTDGPDDMPPSVGWFESTTFEPELWKANYPNTAFLNLRPDDAFWAARLVSRFSDEAIQAMVGSAGYDDPVAAAYLARTLIERRDKIARVWLNGVNPIVDVTLSPTGVLAFTNAAVQARVASHGTYTISWGRFDNSAGTVSEVSVERQTEPRGAVPASLMVGHGYITVTIWSQHAEQPGWSQPVRVFFRNDAAGWTTVGLDRLTSGPAAPSQ